MHVESFIIYIMRVIIFAAAVKTGLFGVNGTLLVHKYNQTTVTTITRGMQRLKIHTT